MRKFLSISLLLVLVLTAAAQPLQAPKREVRAVWLTTLFGLDWPHTKADSPLAVRRQKQELLTILDKCRAANINTILFQSVVRASTVYPSAICPWDACMTGTAGRSPGWDPLAFAVSECHKRGMEIQAWIVAVPVGHNDGYAAKRLKARGYKLLKFEGDSYLDPGASSSANLIASLAREVTTHYDIDGVHLDYIRYPEAMPRPKTQYIADWRRGRITEIVREVHDAVKAEKPWVKVSCSVIGKYADMPRYSSHNWNARDRVSQDVRLWLLTGLVDEIYPMMYFRGNDYYPFAVDWAEHSYGGNVVSGLGTYFLDEREGGRYGWRLDDIAREMMFTRRLGIGTAHFRAKFFLDNCKGIYDFTSNHYAPYPALVPQSGSVAHQLPSAPTSIEVKDGKLVINGTSHYYNIYASDSWPIDVSDARNLVLPRFEGSVVNITGTASWLPRYFAVTSMNRFGDESAPVQSYQPQPLAPGELRCSAGFLLLDTLPSASSVLDIMTLQGTVVLSVPVRALASSRVDVSRLPSGTYLLVLRTRHNKRKEIVSRVGTFMKAEP